MNFKLIYMKCMANIRGESRRKTEQRRRGKMRGPVENARRPIDRLHFVLCKKQFLPQELHRCFAAIAVSAIRFRVFCGVHFTRGAQYDSLQHNTGNWAPCKTLKSSTTLYRCICIRIYTFGSIKKHNLNPPSCQGRRERQVRENLRSPQVTRSKSGFTEIAISGLFTMFNLLSANRQKSYGGAGN